MSFRGPQALSDTPEGRALIQDLIARILVTMHLHVWGAAGRGAHPPARSDEPDVETPG
jgi:hypothetical protein